MKSKFEISDQGTVKKLWDVVQRQGTELVITENFALHPDREKRRKGRELLRDYKGGNVSWQDLCMEYEKWKGNPISRDHLRKLMFPDG